MTIGIYVIQHKTSLKTYLGSSKHIELRFEQHIKKPSNSYLDRALKKYGISNFSFEILEECFLEDLKHLETTWLHALAEIKWPLYNIAKEAVRINPGLTFKEWLGEERAEEIGLKISIGNIGKLCKEETKKKISKAIKENWESSDNTLRCQNMKLAYNLNREHRIATTMANLEIARQSQIDHTLYVLEKDNEITCSTRVALHLPGTFGRLANNFNKIKTVNGYKILASPLTCLINYK